MPTYQYACTACGEQHEAVQAFTDAPLSDCPACGGRLRKVFSAVGVVFKGSGFYKNDSRSTSKGSGEGAAAKTDSATATKAEGGSSSATKSDGGAVKTDSGSSRSDSTAAKPVSKSA